MRGPSAIRAAAWGAVVLGTAAPFVRRRLRLPPPVVIAAAAAAPLALSVAMRRSKARDVAVVGLQMHAYVATYQMPNDDPERLLARVRVRYPVVRRPRASASASCRACGCSAPSRAMRASRCARPSRRSCGATGCGSSSRTGRSPTCSPAARDQLAGGAAQIYAVFDLGLIGYWARAHRAAVVRGRAGGPGPRQPSVRRLMREHGQAVWKGAWGPLYDVLGGNPLAAMPSLHFATSVMAAHVLSDAGPVQGALGWAYAGTLGFALVYLGEHYVVDLARRPGSGRGRAPPGPPSRAGAARGESRALQRLEARAHA